MIVAKIVYTKLVIFQSIWIIVMVEKSVPSFTTADVLVEN